jgi:hypothetical protein
VTVRWGAAWAGVVSVSSTLDEVAGDSPVAQDLP